MIALDERIYISGKSNDAYIIVYIEQKKVTANHIDESFDYLIKIIDDKNLHVIFDLTQATPPNAEVRDRLRQRLNLLEDRILSYSIVTGKNYLIKVAVKFVAASIGINNMSSYASIADAKQAILSAN